MSYMKEHENENDVVLHAQYIINHPVPFMHIYSNLHHTIVDQDHTSAIWI